MAELHSLLAQRESELHGARQQSAELQRTVEELTTLAESKAAALQRTEAELHAARGVGVELQAERRRSAELQRAVDELRALADLKEAEAHAQRRRNAELQKIIEGLENLGRSRGQRAGASAAAEAPPNNAPACGGRGDVVDAADDGDDGTYVF